MTQQGSIRRVPAVRPHGADDDVGVPLSFELVYRRFWPYVARIAHRLLGPDGDVEDVVQEVFVIALRRLHLVRDPRALPGWLSTIAVRRVQRRLTWRRVRAALRLDPQVERTLPADTLHPDRQTDVCAAYQVLARVAPKARVAWILRVVEDQPLEVVARLCGCSLATAKRRVAAAQRELDRDPRE